MTKKSTVLIVDDILVNRILLEGLIESFGYQTVLAGNGSDALSIIKNNPPDLILLDVIMPSMNGYELLEYLKSDFHLKSIPVILISAMDHMDDIVKGIELGADDYLVKPFNVSMLKVRVTTCLEKKYQRDMERYYLEEIKHAKDTLEERVHRQVEEITENQLGLIFGMCKIAESFDDSTGEHLDRMREYCKVLAIEMQSHSKYDGVIDDEFIDTLYKASPLHDIGKIAVPEVILKKPGKLSSIEFETMKHHSQKGAQALMDVYRECPSNDLLHMGAQIAGSHHEKWDGSGYPSGLKGNEIPLPARILALGDVYDALTSSRCYKEAFSHDESKRIILEGSGNHFDPDIVNAFLRIEDVFLEIKNNAHNI